jgi:hypothetical protein
MLMGRLSQQKTERNLVVRASVTFSPATFHGAEVRFSHDSPKMWKAPQIFSLAQDVLRERRWPI